MTHNERDENLPRLISFKEVRRLCGLCRSSIWRLEARGEFPRRRRITKSKVGWVLSEVLSWIEQRETVTSDAQPTQISSESQDQEKLIKSPPVRRRSWLDD